MPADSGTDFVTKIPALSDDADIQAALKNFLYGSEGNASAGIGTLTATDGTEGLAGHLNTMKTATAAKLPLSGGTVTGNIVASTAPTIGNHLTNKTYVDSFFPSSTDNAIPKFHLTGGTLQNSGVTIDDSNNVSTSTAPTSGNHLTNKTYVDAEIASAISGGGAALPVGAVTAYAGTTGIPSGWLVCDGSTFSAVTYPDLYAVLGDSDTLPDLVDRFVKGVASSPGSSGGSKTIAEANLPAHTHDISHTHGGTAASDGSHTHTVSGTAASNGYHNHGVPIIIGSYWASGSAANGAKYGAGGSTEYGGTHTHTVTGTAASDGSHTHTISTTSQSTPDSGSTGSGTDYEPKYYELIYIIKAE